MSEVGPKGQPGIPPIDAAPDSGATDRRGFLKLVGRGAGLALLGNAVAGPNSGNITHEPEGDWGYGDDIKVAGLALGSELASYAAMRKVGLNVGNAGIGEISETVLEHPIRGAVGMIGTLPLLEEGIFRLAPSALADTVDPRHRNSRRWALGTSISLGFALMHNYKTEKTEKFIYPVPQFISGMFQWYVQRRGGYRHAALTHAFHNSFSYAAIFVGAKAAKIQSELEEKQNSQPNSSN